MEPRIQYAKTADGVSIAFYTLGQGMPLVYTGSLSHIQLEWQDAENRRWLQRLSTSRTVVRYDGRGTGLSERDASDFSVQAQALDLDAVVDRLGLNRFALLATFNSGPVAITYAARHSERVARLVLWCAWARASDWSRAAQYKALGRLLETDWETYTETYANIMFGWSAGEEARRWAASLRESITQKAMRLYAAAIRGLDVDELLPQVKAPTLVLHRRQYRWLDVDVARRLASRIPDARLVLVEGTSGPPWREDEDALVQAIDEFLDEGKETPARALAKEHVHTILFTDIEGSTTLTQRLGDARAQEFLRAHNAIVRDALKACGGAEIKHTGDGIMASFVSVSHALGCAIAVQRAVAARVEEHPDMPLRVRIGLNAGEPVAEDQDLFGTAVQLAARICARAEPGQILVPTVVRELAAGKGFLLADLGEIALRGFEDPVRLYEVRWREEG